MAREFSTSEIIRQKCSICGINNKKYMELVYDNEMVGYKLTCCNCNHVNTFISNINHIADHIYKKGREVCVHLTTCKNKTCPYYNMYPLWTATTKIDDILNNKCDPDDNIDSENNQNNNIEKSDMDKLVINGYEIDEPKFH